MFHLKIEMRLQSRLALLQLSGLQNFDSSNSGNTKVCPATGTCISFPQLSPYQYTSPRRCMEDSPFLLPSPSSSNPSNEHLPSSNPSHPTPRSTPHPCRRCLKRWFASEGPKIKGWKAFGRGGHGGHDHAGRPRRASRGRRLEVKPGETTLKSYSEVM